MKRPPPPAANGIPRMGGGPEVSGEIAHPKSGGAAGPGGNGDSIAGAPKADHAAGDGAEQAENGTNGAVHTGGSPRERDVGYARENADTTDLLECVDTAVLVLDPGHKILSATPTARRLFRFPKGYSPSLLAVQHEFGIVDLGGFATAVSIHGTARECEVRDKNGRWYLLRGRPHAAPAGGTDGTVLALVDIDKVKRADDAVRASELYFRTLTQSLSEIIWTALPNGQMDFVNQQWLDYSGQTLLEVQTSPNAWMRALHPDDRERTERVYRNGIRSGKDFSVEMRLLRVDGTYRWFLSRASALHDTLGSLIKYFGTATDIEDMKRAQTLVAVHSTALEGAVAERTAELSQTIGELEEMSYSVAHDMRTPLRAMRGFAELMLEGHAANLDSEGLEFLGKIAGAAQRMDSLIDDLLTYTRVLRFEGKMQSVDVEAVLRGIIETYPQLKSNGTVIAFEGSIPRVLGNDASLSQCLSNLLANAVKFVPAGTTPIVTIGAEDREPHVRIWIRDNGVGIDPKDHERIFKIFERVSSNAAYPGTGIGLAVVRKAIERLNGRVGVESAPGRGSTFWIELPKPSPQ